MLERDAAASVARQEARQRHGGRMFLSGSEQPCGGGLVLIVETAQQTQRGLAPIAEPERAKRRCAAVEAPILSPAARSSRS